MATWSNIFKVEGEYISPSFSISSTLDKYIVGIKEDAINPNGDPIRYFFRISYNNFDWEDWTEFYLSSSNMLEGIKLLDVYIQFKIVIQCSDATSKPYLKKLELNFVPFAYIDNIGDLNVKPKLWIRKTEKAGNIAIIHESTQQRLEMKNLNLGEEVYIDCANEEIVSSAQSSGVYRFDDFNDEFLELIKGDNYLGAEGDFELDIRFNGKLLQERNKTITP